MSITSSVPASVATRRFPVGALLLLSAGVFVTVTAESLPAGMLPEMSTGLGVSPERVGLLISVWAVTVIVTSIPLSRLLAFVDRRLVVAGSLIAFAVANLATALVSDYTWALGLRVFAAVAHGVFWAVVIVYASSLLAPSHLGRGLAIVTAGGTAATAAGLPAGALLAQVLGWRAAFAAVGLLAIALAAVIFLLMPRLRPERPEPRAVEAGFHRDPSLPALVAFGIASVLIALTQFAAFTYVRPYLDVTAGLEPGWSAAMLSVYGIAGMAGVVVAAFLADRRPRAGIAVTVVVFAGAFGMLTLGAGSIVAVVTAMVLWGYAVGALFPLLNATLMRVATDRTRTLASAGMVVLFNVGIAVGPWLGGILGGATAPALTTAMSTVGMLVAGLAILAGFVLHARRPRG